MKDIRIFVASSKELLPERNALAYFVLAHEDEFAKRGLRVRLSKWEYVDPTMTEERTEDRYLDEMLNCDAVLMLFQHVLGKYTKEEVDKAIAAEITGTSRIKKHLILFKEGDEDESPELAAWRASLAEGEYSTYRHLGGLVAHFERLVEELAKCQLCETVPDDFLIRTEIPFEDFCSNRDRIYRTYYDIVNPDEMTPGNPTEAWNELLKASLWQIDTDKVLYHYMPYDCFMSMLKEKAIRLDKPRGYSAQDEHCILPDIVRASRNEYASLSQIKNTSYIKCFSEDANNNKLWMKSSTNRMDNAVRFSFYPLNLLKSLISSRNLPDLIRYVLARVNYLPFELWHGRIVAPMDMGITERQYESLTTLPATDENGEPTSYVEEHEVRLIYEKLGAELSADYIWHPIVDFSFIDTVAILDCEFGKEHDEILAELFQYDIQRNKIQFVKD